MIPKSFCNPLPLPDYPLGLYARENVEMGYLNNDQVVSYRETADPSVIYEDGKWYLYASCGMVWVSSDLANWEYHPIELPDLNYAPCADRKSVV